MARIATVRRIATRASALLEISKSIMVFRPFFTLLDGTPPVKVYASPICHRFAARDITLSGAGGHPGFLQSDLEFVDFAVKNLGSEPKHILAMQLLRDPRKRRRQLIRFLEQEEAAAGFFRQSPQASVRARADLARAVEVFVLEANRVDHHILDAAAIRHIA